MIPAGERGQAALGAIVGGAAGAAANAADVAKEVLRGIFGLLPWESSGSEVAGAASSAIVTGLKWLPEAAGVIA